MTSDIEIFTLCDVNLPGRLNICLCAKIKSIKVKVAEFPKLALKHGILLSLLI